MTLTEHQVGDRRDLTYSVPQRHFSCVLVGGRRWSAAALAATLVAATGVSVWVLRAPCSVRPAHSIRIAQPVSRVMTPRPKTPQIG